MLQGGDDLSDDFVVDNLVALSDDEDSIVEDNAYFSDAAEEVNNVRREQEGTISVVDPILKKRKRREKEKERKAKVSIL